MDLQIKTQVWLQTKELIIHELRQSDIETHQASASASFQ